jgi:type IV pilus assembly protein PilM
MLKSKSFLAVDFGAGTLKLAEFEINEAGGLRLKNYQIKPLGPEGAQESTREATVQKALQEVTTAIAPKSKVVNVCAPGFHVFSKFVQLPPVDTNKVNQIIQYEAQQNVPFPLEEVVWDYQILGSTQGGELEVLLVAIKSDVVEGLFRATESVGLHLQLTDVSPAALCNSFRYNYGELDDCTMLLDIGAKTSNLLFFEKGKIFARSINLGANSITQDFINEKKKISWAQAEKAKIEDGFVSLGGAYEEPENEDAAAISKIARQFMTRLHIQVNQTMQFYRGQQGGSVPVRLFLSGGASIMPYTAQFFTEKLGVPVEYFNPLRNVQIDPSINLEELARVAHMLGEVVGLGLRNMAHCPVELNLMPESTLKWQRFNQKKPYFIATVFSLVAVIAAIGLLFDRLASIKDQELQKIHSELEPKQRKSEKFKREYNQLKQVRAEADQLTQWIQDRYYWADVFTELRQVLLRVEAATKASLRVEPGIWIEQVITAIPQFGVSSGLPGMEGMPGMPGMPPGAGMSPEERDAMIARYGPAMNPEAQIVRPEMPMAEMMPPEAMPQPQLGPDGNPLPVAAPVLTNGVISITFRAVSLTRASNQPEANKSIAYRVVDEIRASPLFDAEQTRFASDVGNEEEPGTFTFTVIAKLKRELKL